MVSFKYSRYAAITILHHIFKSPADLEKLSLRRRFAVVAKPRMNKGEIECLVTSSSGIRPDSQDPGHPNSADTATTQNGEVSLASPSKTWTSQQDWHKFANNLSQLEALLYPLLVNRKAVMENPQFLLGESLTFMGMSKVDGLKTHVPQ